MAEIIPRVGMGYDVHAFAPEQSSRALILGGIVIPYHRGLAGHSDADVLLHAVVDALLGAAGLGDIGTYFPSSDPQWQDAPSRKFLESTMGLLRQHGWEVGNIDATIVAEHPRLAPHIQPMRQQVAEITGIPLERISVKAKTTDTLGFAGREEGVACYAIALLVRI